MTLILKCTILIHFENLFEKSTFDLFTTAIKKYSLEIIF